MRLPIKARHLAPRLITGAFILNSGLGKFQARHDEQTAQALHGMAAGSYPFLRRVPPATFVTLLAAAETALGGALLLPVVPTAVAGAGLTAFSGGLLGLYFRTPGLRKPGSLAPTQDGLPIAKDSWLLGIGLGFLTDACAERRRCCR
ncbi:hypothetical protein ACIQGZ_00255 [Streptomyces sp. NPDC092296]|uniref:hypothetical protein n=1 Tax=Streptomyces sp. NPDC092296 TaxID=3366012 RepID=UPI00382628B0